MKKLSSSQLRDLFLKFFEENGHEIKPSQSLIPINDPTLLWINSGVATLKKYFDGSEVPSNPRITNSQKSIRTNDIENVGYTARHHTLFEMLGNFSIGDYQKETAIRFAWEFLTSPDYLAFDPNLLYVTYYPEDTETRDIWKQMPNFDASHLIAEEGNFWDIGAGPCGPNTEIFYDRGEQYNDLPEGDPENYPGGENERWLEIWNLVFSEFNHMPDDTYQPLPAKNVDTGMGLERLVSVVQDTPTNFETDLFIPIIHRIEQLTNGIKYETAGDLQVSFKVIADHIRAVTFAISDGALPSNEGRGYIIRRLIRRSIMHARRLGIHNKFLAEIVPVIGEIMGDFYPELIKNEDFVQNVLSQEEDRFHETLEAGEQLLENTLRELKESGKSEIPGDKAFQLYDTYGFPLELTEEEALARGFTVDHEGFEQAMAAQRERARAARHDEDSMQVQTDVLKNITSSFDFLGYHALNADATIKHILIDDQEVNELPAGQSGWVIFNRSPFYAEMGGQIADTGVILDGSDELGEIMDVQKAPNGQFMHKIRVEHRPLKKEQSYTLLVDRQRRLAIIKNHTATHLLHKGLKNVLGPHAVQAGSYVGPDRLRFDFSNFGKMSTEEIKQVEEYVNHWIDLEADVMITEMTIDEAKAIGAEANFEEKYGDIVRVVNIGNESIELCGGIHVVNTASIGQFKILNESGIGAGVRRIEAITGAVARDYYQDQEKLLQEAQTLVKAKQPDQVVPRIKQLQDQLKEALADNAKFEQEALKKASENIFNDVQTIGDVSYIAFALENQSTEAIRQLGDTWRDKEVSDILIVANHNQDNAQIMVFVSDEGMQAGYKAGDIIKPLAKYVGGGGGGRPTMAQAGGKNPGGIPEMLDAIPSIITEMTKQ